MSMALGLIFYRKYIVSVYFLANLIIISLLTLRLLSIFLADSPGTMVIKQDCSQEDVRSKDYD